MAVRAPVDSSLSTQPDRVSDLEDGDCSISRDEEEAEKKRRRRRSERREELSTKLHIINVVVC